MGTNKKKAPHEERLFHVFTKSNIEERLREAPQEQEMEKRV